jgi:hypothetical protein
MSTSTVSVVSDLIQRITEGKLRQLRMGPKFSRTVLHYITLADELFTPDEDEQAREWVREQLRGLAAGHNIRWLPDWLETPIEELAINLIVDLGWELLHSKAIRAKIVASQEG